MPAGAARLQSALEGRPTPPTRLPDSRCPPWPLPPPSLVQDEDFNPSGSSSEEEDEEGGEGGSTAAAAQPKRECGRARWAPPAFVLCSASLQRRSPSVAPLAGGAEGGDDASGGGGAASGGGSSNGDASSS